MWTLAQSIRLATKQPNKPADIRSAVTYPKGKQAGEFRGSRNGRNVPERP